MSISAILEVIGGLTVFFYLLESLWSPIQLIFSFLKPLVTLTKDRSLKDKFGEWAVVTGGTDGIGKQYALQLAKRGLNVVIISRNPDKLKAVATEIETLYNVKTKTIVADFSRGSELYAHIEEQIKDVPIGMLVNNVGMYHESPKLLAELAKEEIRDVINVNVVATTYMTHCVLDGMVRRGRGAIVNIGSLIEMAPLVYSTLYTASKAYIHNFTIALRMEYEPKGIFVQQVEPSFISTNMTSFSQILSTTSILVPDAETFVKHAIVTLGRVNCTTGYWCHGIQKSLLKLLPSCLLHMGAKQLSWYIYRDYQRTLRTKKQ